MSIPFVADYRFNNMCNLSNDSDYQTQNSLMNTEQANYIFANFHTVSGDTMKNIAFANNLAYNDSNSMSISDIGKAVDTSTRLMYGSTQVMQKGRINTNQRPYLTIPNLSRGIVNSDMERHLLVGENQFTSRKTYTNLPEQTSVNNYTAPIMTARKNNIQQHQNAYFSDHLRPQSTKDAHRDER